MERKQINITIMKKNQINSCFLFLITTLFYFTSNAQTLKVTSKIVQSPYYDAKALYYALHNYSAYPIFSENKPIEDKTIITGTDTIEKKDLAGKKNTGPLGTESTQDATKKPVVNGAENFQPNSNNSTSIAVYKIIESATGKILSDTVTDNGLKNFMESVEFTNEDDRKELMNQILARNDQTDNIDYGFLASEYKDNGYLSDIFDVSKKGFFIKPISLNGGKLAVSNLGGGAPSVATISEGLAEFYIERVNEEINDAFFIHLKEALEKFAELKILFPNTLESLTKIEVTKYNQVLNILKTAYEADIKNLLSNIGGLADIEKYQTLINKHNELTLLFTTCDLMSLIKQGKSVADILYFINQSPYIQKTQPNIYNASIKLAALFSYAFTDVQIGNEIQTNLGWINLSKINELRNDDAFFKIFMGLIAQNAKGIKCNAFNFRDLLIKEQPEIIIKKYIISNFIETSNSITSKINNLNIKASKTNLSATINDYINITGDVANLSNKAIGILPTTKATLLIQKEITKIKNEYIPLLQQSDSVLYHIEKQEYSMAVYKADNLLNLLFKKNSEDIDIDTSLSEKEQQDQLDSLNDLSYYFLHYGLFISSVAEAKSANDIKQAINAFALPKGSSRIKKEHRFSWGINSYVGFAYSWNTQYKGVSLAKTSTSITAPLGIAVNWARFFSGSFTIYGGIIDIGAIFTYKISSDSSIKSDIRLGQILSPSLGIVYGLPITTKGYNIPLSIGANYQWGPTLKKVTNSQSSVLPLLAGKFNVFVAIDIPIINFHVSRK